MFGLLFPLFVLLLAVTSGQCKAYVHQNPLYNDLRKILLPSQAQPAPYPRVSSESEGGLWRPVEIPGWGTSLEKVVGQVTGVSVNSYGSPVIFHRGPRTWTANSFNNSYHYQGTEPIDVDTILVLDPTDGSIISSFGAGLFFMPHGITVDPFDNVWLTDVARHQVIMFGNPFLEGWQFPYLSLGEFFQPGQSRYQFCQPTSVAVATTRDVFVADGYCNSRIMKFNQRGQLARIYPQNQEFLSLVVPHSLALIESQDVICVSDRENMRVACLDAETKEDGVHNATATITIHQPDLGRVFAIAANGQYLFAVNGPTSPMIPVQGFTINPFTEQIIDHWTPSSRNFKNPHDIAVSPNGDCIYVSEIGPNKLWKFHLVRPSKNE